MIQYYNNVAIYYFVSWHWEHGLGILQTCKNITQAVAKRSLRWIIITWSNIIVMCQFIILFCDTKTQFGYFTNKSMVNTIEIPAIHTHHYLLSSLLLENHFHHFCNNKSKNKYYYPDINEATFIKTPSSRKLKKLISLHLLKGSKLENCVMLGCSHQDTFYQA